MEEKEHSACDDRDEDGVDHEPRFLFFGWDDGICAQWAVSGARFYLRGERCDGGVGRDLGVLFHPVLDIGFAPEVSGRTALGGALYFFGLWEFAEFDAAIDSGFGEIGEFTDFVDIEEVFHEGSR